MNNKLDTAIGKLFDVSNSHTAAVNRTTLHYLPNMASPSQRAAWKLRLCRDFAVACVTGLAGQALVYATGRRHTCESTEAPEVTIYSLSDANAAAAGDRTAAETALLELYMSSSRARTFDGNTDVAS